MQTYTTSEFAQKAHVTGRTIRYYDEQGVLKPSGYEENGYRTYTDADFVQLQKIMSLKYLGFSLKEISQLVRGESDQDLLELFDLQIHLMQQKLENMQRVQQALIHARGLVETKGNLEWDEVNHLIYLMEMENQLVEHYKNAEHINARIHLHTKCAKNQQGWFPWLLEQADVSHAQRVLELGCGNGELWIKAKGSELTQKKILLSDASVGMVEDARSRLEEQFGKEIFSFAHFDCEEIPLESKEFDRILANHVLFYCKNVSKALAEIGRVLTEDGMFCCSTYGSNHMKEISELVKGFDSKINLSEISLYEIFGLENGEKILNEHFEEVNLQLYEDALYVEDAGLLCDYIYSCHGNQNELLCDRKAEFRTYLEKQIQESGGIHITKEAGVFVCRKPR